MKVLKLIPVVFTISILVLAVPFSAFGIVFDPALLIPNPDPLYTNSFSRSVSLNENRVLIGAQGHSGNGAAYLYDLSGNLQLTFLNPIDPSFPAPQFGHSVSIFGNNVVISAHNNPTGSGEGIMYVFDINTCDADTSNGGIPGDNICEAETLRILNPDPQASDFGWSTEISGNKVLVGAYFFGDGGLGEAGRAYYFDITTCDDDISNGGSVEDNTCEAATLTFPNPTPVSQDRFGNSVSIDGNNVLIGTPWEDTGANAAGSSYYFDITTCDAADGSVDGICDAPTLTFANPTPEDGDAFGESVSISGNSIVIGAKGDRTGADGAGAAYLFDITTCDADTSNGGTDLDGICEAENLVFLNPTPALSELFGQAVSISGNNVLVGSRDNSGALDAGAAYLFDLTTCDDDISNGGFTVDGICEAPTNTFLNPTPAVGDFFGYALSVNGNNVLIGSHGDDSGGTNTGTAYLFLENAGGQAISSVNILGTCGLTFVGGNTIAYDDLEPGATSTEKILTVQNTGTIASNVLVSGTNWVDDIPVTVMLVGETAYSNATGNYVSKTSLSGTPTIILDDTQYIPDTPVNTYWQLLANLIDPDFVGSLTQTTTFTVDC